MAVVERGYPEQEYLETYPQRITQFAHAPFPSGWRVWRCWEHGAIEFESEMVLPQSAWKVDGLLNKHVGVMGMPVPCTPMQEGQRDGPSRTSGTSTQ